MRIDGSLGNPLHLSVLCLCPCLCLRLRCGLLMENRKWTMPSEHTEVQSAFFQSSG